MAVRKTNKNTTQDKDNSIPVAFFDYLNMNSLRKSPMCLEGLERIALELIKWAVKNEDALSLRPFFFELGVSGTTQNNWRKRSKKLDAACNYVREIFAHRRDMGAIVKRYDSTYILKTMPIFDEDWKQLEEWRAKLRTTETDTKPTTFNINIPNFTEKKKVPGAKKRRSKKA